MLAQAAETVQNAAGQAAQAAPAYSWTGYFMGIALMFVMLALLWFGARVMKQKGGLRFLGQTPDLNVESRLSLGPRKHLLVVRYRGKRLLLGVTEHHIGLLDEEELSAEEAAEPAQPAPGGSGGLGGKFKDMLHELNKRK